MNKAFVKEDDIQSDPEIERDPRADIPQGSRNYMTPEGARRLRDELEHLMFVDRPRLLEAVNRSSREYPDSEDANLRATRKELQRIERRIDFLVGRLELAEVVDPLQQQGDRVRFGATVKVQPDEGPQLIYRIVGIDEADVEKGCISWTSPLARALLNGRPGDLVKVAKPAGEEELEIVDVHYDGTRREPGRK